MYLLHLFDNRADNDKESDNSLADLRVLKFFSIVGFSSIHLSVPLLYP